MSGNQSQGCIYWVPREAVRTIEYVSQAWGHEEVGQGQRMSRGTVMQNPVFKAGLVDSKSYVASETHGSHAQVGSLEVGSFLDHFGSGMRAV